MPSNRDLRTLLILALLGLFIESGIVAAAELNLPANRWVQVCQDPAGGRRGSALRYAPAAGAFFLWGYMNADYELLQERETMPVPEHDMVFFDPAQRQWRNHLPKAYEAEWSKQLPPVYIPRTYAGITTGSERSLFRPPPGYPIEAARPDVNIVFDQVVYHPPSKSLVYFAGGLTVSYDVESRRWSNLAPPHSPPPVIGGSLAHDSVHDELVLFGGGNVAEEGPGGRIVGYTGTWAYSLRDKDWQRLTTERQPPPRMNSRLVCDDKNQLLVLFGGDGQSHYLADTWLFDLRTRQWRESRAKVGPPPRAGHFTVYDPQTGWVIVGGGYHRQDLADMWAFDAATEQWQRLAGDVPAGFCLSADIAPEKRLILLTTDTRKPGDRTLCNVLYPVRTTYGYRIDSTTIKRPERAESHAPMPKRAPEAVANTQASDSARFKAHAELLKSLPVNRWTPLADPARTAPVRTWGSATFDTDRGRILIWGGGHCGYGGSDVDAYDVASHTWISSSPAPEFPHRLWDHGVRSAGVTFGGNPWMEHGRRIYAYDPVSRRMIMARPIRLTTGYLPERLRDFPGVPRTAADAKVQPATSYNKFATWSLDLDTGKWEILGPAPLGLDTLTTTRHGVVGLNVDWPTRLNDAGYLLPFNPDLREDKALYLFDAARKEWNRLGPPQESPQYLYELTTLVYDSKRDQVILHGGGKNRTELWTFDLQTKKWQNRNPKVAGQENALPPACNREAVYLPDQDVMITFGPGRGRGAGPAFWAYRVDQNTWYQVAMAPPPGIEPRVAAGQNRALVYDSQRDLALLVLGTGGDRGKSHVFALRYRHAQGKFVGVQ